MTTKLLHITVPYNFDLPPHLTKATPEQVEHALKLADILLEAGLHFQHNSDMKQLREKIKALESTTVENLREEAVRIAKAELRAEVQGKDNLLTTVQRQLEDTKNSMEELKKEKNKLQDTINNKDNRIDELHNKNNELQDKLQQRITIQSNSSKRGQEGEKDFQLITSNIREWKLESVGKTKESADFRSTIHTLEVRFEVKNHKEKVPYSENVDKFERDMKKHPETKVGVFVALTASIEKLDDSITIRWTDDKQLLVFIPHFLTRDLTYTYDIIEGFIRTMKHMKPYFETKDTSKDLASLQEKINDTIKTIQILDKQIETIQSDHKDYNTKMLANYSALKSIVASTLSSLTGKEIEEEKPKQKRKPRTQKKEENEVISE